jgi:hypothetical protein
MNKHILLALGGAFVFAVDLFADTNSVRRITADWNLVQGLTAQLFSARAAPTKVCAPTGNTMISSTTFCSRRKSARLWN